MGTEALEQLSGEQVIAAAARGELSEAQIEQLAQDDPHLTKLALIAAVQAVTQLRGKAAAGEQPDPATPSGQQPVYAKPNRSGRRKKRGAKVGHKGHRRPTPEQIDRHVEHEPLEQCPCCGDAVSPPRKHRKRIIIDLPENLSTDTAEHKIPRQWCGSCKRYVEPTVLDAMPKSTLGHRTVATTAWLHYGLGVTIDQIVSIFSIHLNTKLSAGGLVAMWHRLARELLPWYEQIGEQAKRSAHLHADETGWRVDGATQWLWCFANPRCCYYMIDPSRGSPALGKFFTDSFDGVLISDFWSAYESVNADERQYCLVHLLRELTKVDQHNVSLEWRTFAKKLRRLIRDAVRLRRRCEHPLQEHSSRVQRIHKRLCALADATYEDADAQRLAKRLSRHRDWLFTFLDYPHVPWENNFAERQIRPAVILRKNSQSNRSEKGAATQAVLMSVFRTLKLRGHNPTETIAHALRHLLQHDQLPPLPDQPVADG